MSPMEVLAHLVEWATKDTAYAREIVSRFAESAWRRPVQSAEVDRLMEPVEQARKLAAMFRENFAQYRQHVSEAVANAGPK